MTFLAIPLTLLVYWLAARAQRRLRWAVLNPVLLAMTALIAIFLVARPQLAAYQAGTRPLTWLLNPAVVALAVPLYRQLPRVRERLLPIALALGAGVVTSIVTGTVLALATGGTRRIAESLAPKAVTTPVAMAVSQAAGGVPSITAAAVIFAGILGASFGFALLSRLGIEDDECVGIAMGAASHALGTARCAEHSARRGAFSSLALVICALATSVVTPLLLPALLR